MSLLSQSRSHIAVVCYQKLKAEAKATNAVTELADTCTDEYTLLIDCVTSANISHNPMTVTVLIEDVPVHMEVDTGASLSLMSYSTLSTVLPKVKLKSHLTKLRTYTGEEIVVKGAIDVNVKYGDQTTELKLIIVNRNGPTHLGRDWLQHLKLDWATLNHISKGNSNKLQSLLTTHSVLFSQGLGCIKGTTAKFHLKDGSQPHFFRARQVLYAWRDKVAKEIDRQVELEILEPVKFSLWATPVVPILKKDGSIRLCGDYRITVNRETVTESYPLPRVEDLLAV